MSYTKDYRTFAHQGLSNIYPEQLLRNSDDQAIACDQPGNNIRVTTQQRLYHTMTNGQRNQVRISRRTREGECRPTTRGSIQHELLSIRRG